MANVLSVALGLFDDAEGTQRALAALKAVGFESEDIVLLEPRRRPLRRVRGRARSGFSRRARSRLPVGVDSIAVALVSRGMPEDQAWYLVQEVRNGNSLLAVRTRGSADVAEAILHRFGAYDVRPLAGGSSSGSIPVSNAVPGLAPFGLPTQLTGVSTHAGRGGNFRFERNN